MLTLIILSVGFFFSIIFIKYFAIPYILIAIFWLLLFLILIFISKTSVKKSIYFNFAFCAFILGTLEVYSYFSLKNQEKNSYIYEGGYTKGYSVPNEILGYGPSKNKTIRSKKYYKNQLIYDVTYTIGKDLLRITPSVKSNYNQECLLFFGGSYTFGEGVDDHSSMPYIVGTLQEYKVHNFGFHGYGPHQMLSAIENGLVTCKPKLVIYQALTAHVPRSAGYSSWDKHGPKYILHNGRLKYDGRFIDHAGYGDFIKKKIDVQLNKSSFYRKFFNNDRYTITNQDIQLFLEIIDVARNKLVEDYPEVDFHVILWDNRLDDNTYQKVRDGLQIRSIKYHLISDMLPGFLNNKKKYIISPYDKHPNPLAHQLIAEHIVKNIMDMEKPLIEDKLND